MSFDSTALLRAPDGAPQPMPACSAEPAPAAVAQPPYVHSGQLKDHLYLLPHGVVYTSPWLITKATTGSSGNILLSAQRKPFELNIARQTVVSSALAIRPLQERVLRAENRQLISILIHPTHPHYRRFRAIGAPGCQPLDRDAFSGMDDLLQSAYLGQLGISGAQELLETAVAIAVRYLPRIRSKDERCEQILHMLQENPGCQLKDLAEALGVSADRMPHLFTRAVGLPWRSFQLWQKVRAVGAAMGSGRSLTEIAIAAGFSDSAHLSNTWHQAFGAAPSKFFNHQLVQVHYGLCREPAQRAAASATAARCVCPHCGGALDN
jgi:AraC-like DNA-binding protein